MTKSRIFKNLKKKSRSQLSRRFAEKPFQAHKILLKSPKLIGQKLLSYECLLKDKRLKFTFLRRANLSGFATWEFTAKQDFKNKKPGISTSLKILARAETKNLVIFLWEKVCIRKLCGVKAKGFWFKSQCFPLSACCSYPCRRSWRIYYRGHSKSTFVVRGGRGGP